MGCMHFGQQVASAPQAACRDKRMDSKEMHTVCGCEW